MRREYTWKSMLTLMAFSISLVWLLYFLFGERDRVLQKWDLVKLGSDRWEWRFPEVDLQQEPNGAAFLLKVDGIGPRIDGLAVDTAEVGRVQVCMYATDVATGAEVTPDIELYWARDADLEAAKGAWPFTVQRGCAFSLLDRHRPHTYTAQPANARVCDGKQWDGVVKSMFIGIGDDELPSRGYRILVSRIEFLRETDPAIPREK